MIVRRGFSIAMIVVTVGALVDVGVVQVEHARARAATHRDAPYEAALKASKIQSRHEANKALATVTLPSSFVPVSAGMHPACEPSIDELCRYSPEGPRAALTALLTAMRAAGLPASSGSCTLVIAGGTSGAAPMHTRRVEAPCIGRVLLETGNYLNLVASARWIPNASPSRLGPRFRGSIVTVDGEDPNFP